MSKTHVRFETNQGTIEIKLFPEIAPKTCQNFTTHVENGYYDGLIFHRVIPDFMIQGGDPTGTGRGGESIWGKPFEDECDPDLRFDKVGLLAMANAGPGTNGGPGYQFEDEFDKSLRHDRPGRLSMANAGPGTNGSQFFLTTAKTPWLNMRHTIFGEVTSGYEVVEAIESVATDGMDKPLDEQKILKASVIS